MFLWFLHFALASSGLATFQVSPVTIDGDTVKTPELHYRLKDIDSPELKQPFGKECKTHLDELLTTGTVQYETFGKDKYGRQLTDLYVNGVCVNKQMVIDGYAWAYGKRYRKEQEASRSARMGLWTQDNPENPKDFRKENRRKHGSLWFYPRRNSRGQELIFDSFGSEEE